jgi:glycosyltransferase involved in cell wall biosynthesis
VAARLRIAGTGELEDELRRRARDAGVAECVEFLGALPHDAMPGFYAAADVFLFTSLQDTSGNVVLEAMAHGLPVVALDHHGVPEMVCDDCGVRIPVGDRESVIAGFADALQRFAENPTLSVRVGAAAREHVRLRHGWERKRELIDELYAVAASRTRSPHRVTS